MPFKNVLDDTPILKRNFELIKRKYLVVDQYVTGEKSVTSPKVLMMNTPKKQKQY